MIVNKNKVDVLNGYEISFDVKVENNGQSGTVFGQHVGGTLSWICVLGAFPFAMLGFVRYHGMNAEQFLWAWIKSEFLNPKCLLFRPENLYYEMLKTNIEKRKKEGLKNMVRTLKNYIPAG